MFRIRIRLMRIRIQRVSSRSWLKVQGHEIGMDLKWFGKIAAGYKSKFSNCPVNILIILKILKQGTQIAFEFYLNFQKLREDLSLL